jgi:arylsulfatase A-like enzyme
VKRITAGIWFRAFVTCLLSTAGTAHAQNVILIIADDMGVDATSIYGEETPVAPTPNIDALAALGVLFRNAWAEPVCSPFRAAALTGTNPSENGMGHALNQVDPDFVYMLPTSGANLAAILSTAGHRTAAVGKWHLGTELGIGYTEILTTETATESHPNDLGFDYYAGFVYGGADYWGYPKTTNGDTVWVSDYATTDNANEAIGQIAGSEPFFLWLAFRAPHGPFHEPPNELLADPSIYNGFASPRDRYMAMIEAMDTEMGRVMASVDLSDTTVIFVGDNGTPGSTINPPLLSNHAKRTVYEGGLNVPLIVAGQAVAADAAGEESAALVQATDLFSTILEIAGAVAPATSDSVSMVPYLEDPTTPSIRETVFAELFLPNGGEIDPGSHLRAAREARYKLVRRSTNPDELYDLETDPYEQSPLDLTSLTPEQQQIHATLSAVIILKETARLPVSSLGGRLLLLMLILASGCRKLRHRATESSRLRTRRTTHRWPAS